MVSRLMNQRIVSPGFASKRDSIDVAFSMTKVAAVCADFLVTETSNEAPS